MNTFRNRSEASKALVMIVDDVLENLQILGHILDEHGYDVAFATSGAQVLESLSAISPEVILLDVSMPEMDGFEVCRRLKANPATADIAVIFLTAHTEIESVIQGFSIGAVDYVTKPFNSAELLSRVQTHVRLRRALHHIVQQSEQIADQNKQLRVLDGEKNQFLGIVAHDLKNPLSGILLLSGLIKKFRYKFSDNEINTHLDNIESVALQMSELIDNLLDINALESGELKMTIETLSISALVEDLTGAYRQRAAQKEISLFLELPQHNVLIRSDVGKTREVLENLISNAIKYSPIGKNIWVRMSIDPNGVRVAVQDEGPGLTDEDKEKLFGRFMRLSAKPTGDESSTGLGLSIVKKLVEAMNGRVWCESEFGQGATFIVTLPSDSAAA